MVSGLEPGTRVQIQVHRRGQALEKTVVIGTQPPVDAAEVDTDFGFTAKQITQTLYLEYRLDQRDGVMISYVSRGTPSQEAELEVGDVLVRVDDTPIRTIEDLRRILPGLARRARVLLTLRRGTVTRYALLDMSPYRAPEANK